ncbi:hypothetical protein [Roseovarius salis]|uniref:hypothetical protein n=1 Tax=Roseovarius salis TaxID=3376063 RepID=UPI0037C72D89
MSASFSKLMKRAHLGATRMIGYALTMNDFETWEAASAVWQARLTPEECAALAWAALRSLDLDHAREVANTVIQDAGAPLPPFISPMDEAAYWADIASPEELEAYCLATFQAMPRGRQAAFLDHVQGRQAA